MGWEYRVIYQREGQEKKRRLYQTEKGARREARRQLTASEEMDWLEPRLPAIVYGPVIEVRQVGKWEAL